MQGIFDFFLYQNQKNYYHSQIKRYQNCFNYWFINLISTKKPNISTTDIKYFSPLPFESNVSAKGNQTTDLNRYKLTKKKL